MNISEKFDVDLIKKNLLPYEGSSSIFLNDYKEAYDSVNINFLLESVKSFLVNGRVAIDSPVDGSDAIAVASVGSLGPQYILMQSGSNYWIVVQNLNFVDCIILSDRILYFSHKYLVDLAIKRLTDALKYFDDIDNFNSDFRGFFLTNKRPYHFFYDQLAFATHIEESMSLNMKDRYSFVFNDTFVDPYSYFDNSFKYVENKLGEVRLRTCLIEYDRTRGDSDVEDYSLLMEGRLNKLSSRMKVDVERFDFVLWVGITGQKRIWVEQIEGYASIIKLLSKNFSNILVVVDGWTAPYGEEVVLPEEEQILNKIRKSCGDTVSFISVIGQDYYHKISICKNVDYFIANAGAGSLVPLRICRKNGVLHRNNGPVTFPDNYSKRGQTIEIVDQKFVKDVDVDFKWSHMVSYHTNWRVLYNLLVQVINTTSSAKLDKLSISSQEVGSDIMVSLQTWQKQLVKNKRVANEDTFVDLLRDLALQFEKHDDIDTAFALMIEAKKLRPGGKFIEEKALKYYDELIKKID